jgi:hypothetical protein
MIVLRFIGRVGIETAKAMRANELESFGFVGFRAGHRHHLVQGPWTKFSRKRRTVAIAGERPQFLSREAPDLNAAFRH